jgi:hypothetical protein
MWPNLFTRINRFPHRTMISEGYACRECGHTDGVDKFNWQTRTSSLPNTRPLKFVYCADYGVSLPAKELLRRRFKLTSPT